jgi:peroxiredoxin
LRVYQKRLSEIQAQGASLVAISPQTPDNSLTMAEKNDLKFEVLSDAGNRVARRFGLVFSLAAEVRTLFKGMGIDLASYNGDESYELPIPGTFVVAPDGTIRLAFVDADYTHRLEPAAIVESLRALKSSS